MPFSLGFGQKFPPPLFLFRKTLMTPRSKALEFSALGDIWGGIFLVISII
jgi:hypothetical protein